MPLQRREIAPEKTAEQLELCERIRLRLGPGERFAMVDTYGCQQNESDSEILRGFLRAMGYTMTGDEQLADVIVVNTCAVREHAQMRVFGNVGALTHVKREHPERIVVVDDGTRVDLGDGNAVTAVATPGHTPGCITWMTDDALFTGDACIPGVRVVTNLPHGDKQLAMRSLEHIRSLAAEGRTIYPGHDVDPSVLTTNISLSSHPNRAPHGEIL